MRIAIVGAGGDVGRTLALHLVSQRVLAPGDQLQLIGHGTEHTERQLLAVRVDLLDAFAEEAPTIVVASNFAEIDADIVVLTAGATVSPERPTRQDLAETNAPLFKEVADALASGSSAGASVVVVSNPVELAVDLLCRRLDRRRVLGMGAQNDSSRFARAIAADVGLRRDRVHALVVGEHGEAFVPLWSSVHLAGLDPREASERLAKSRGNRPRRNLADELQQGRTTMTDLVQAGRIREAFETVETLPADVRMALEPFVVAHCLHSCANSTSRATVDVIRALSTGHDYVINAQVRLEGEFADIRTVFGVPVLANAAGWRDVVCPPLAPDEEQAVARAAAIIDERLRPYQG
jgi:malate dehydrogenase